MTLDRAIGLARSIAIYHAIPFRQRRIRRLYGTFVRRGDLVFDVGAHAGNHVRSLLALGCRVVAVEPQADFARVLRFLFGRSPSLTILETGVGDRAGGRRCRSANGRRPSRAWRRTGATPAPATPTSRRSAGIDASRST